MQWNVSSVVLTTMLFLSPPQRFGSALCRECVGVKNRSADCSRQNFLLTSAEEKKAIQGVWFKLLSQWMK